MREIEKTLALVKRLEGFRPTPYWDVHGWAIGYGTHVKDPPKRITQSEAETLARKHLEGLYAEITGEGVRSLTANQWAAVLSWAYNVGIGNVKRSTLLKALKAGDLAGAARQFDRWLYSRGKPVHARRRAIERAVFEGREEP